MGLEPEKSYSIREVYGFLGIWVVPKNKGTLQGMDTYPTEREVRKIIDSKCHFLGDMLVFWRVPQKMDGENNGKPY